MNWVAYFAAQVGVTSRVRTLLCDALEIPGENCFDVAVAVDSCCHVSRKALFQRLAALLRLGGHMFVTDCFLVQPAYEELFNHHWHVRIGTEEYLTAAREASLYEESVDELSPRVEHFWAMTFALIQAEAQGKKLTLDEAAKLEEAL